MSDVKNENLDWSDWIEKRVCAKGTLFGTLKFVGPIKFKSGLWCGIALDNPSGRNDGTFNDVRYFSCQPKFGIFVPESKVTKIDNCKSQLKDEKNLNATFEVLKEIKTQSVRLSDKTVKIEEKTPKVKSDSEESLGLLNPDVYDLESLDSLIYDKPNSSKLSKEFSSGDFPSVENIVDDVFCDPKVQEIILDDIFCNPKYASTPRHTATKRLTLTEDKNDSKEELSFDNENRTYCNESLHNTTKIIFDTEKFKDNPNLTSTAKIFDSSGISNFSKLNLNLSKDVSKNEDLNKTFPKECKEVLNITFDLKEAIPVQCENKVSDLNDNLNINPNEYIVPKKSNLSVIHEDGLNCTFKLDCLNITDNKELHSDICENSDVNNVENSNQCIPDNSELCTVTNQALESTFVVDDSTNQPNQISSKPVKTLKFSKSSRSKNDKPKSTMRKSICFLGNKRKSVEKNVENVIKVELNSTFYKPVETISENSAVSLKSRKSMPSLQSNKDSNDCFKKPFSVNPRRKIIPKSDLSISKIGRGIISKNTPSNPIVPKVDVSSNNRKDVKPNHEKETKKIPSASKPSIKTTINQNSSNLKKCKFNNAITDTSVQPLNNRTNTQQMSLKDNWKNKMLLKTFPSRHVESDSKLSKFFLSKHIQSDSEDIRRNSISAPIADCVNKRKLSEEILKSNFPTKENISVVPKLPRRNSLCNTTENKSCIGTIKPRFSILPTILDKSHEKIPEELKVPSEKPVLKANSSLPTSTNGSSDKLIQKKVNLKKASSLPRRSLIAPPKFGSSTRGNV